MTFLNPFLLFGLAAAALPLLIHLLNLRRLNTIEFSSLRFLKELQQTRIRRLKLRQILLLIIRTLLVVFLVLAFSRPAIEGNLAGAIGTNARTTMVVLLDDTPSMTVRTERGIKFTQAMRAVKEIGGLAKPGDELYLLTLSDIRHAQTLPPPLPPEGVERFLTEAGPSHASVPFREAAAMMAGTLAESPNINREVYIVSDGQATQFRSQPGDTAALLPDGTRIFFVAITGGENSGNLGIASVSARAQVISPSRPVAYDAHVRNGGEMTAENAVVSVYLDGIRTAQQSVTLAAGDAASSPFSIVPKKTGIIKGAVELEEDAMGADNRRYFSINVPSRIRVALVGSAEDTRYLQLALSAVQSLSGDAFFAVTELEEEALGSANLGSFDILLLSNIRDLSSQEGERLVRFVTGGGGIAFFPGPQTDDASINSTLLKGLNIPSMSDDVASGSVDDGQEASEGSFVFSKIDFAHPIFAGLFEEGIGGGRTDREIESPSIRSRTRLSAGSRGNVVMSLSDGSPFLVEYTAGSGRVLLYSVDPTLAWSDFPLSGIFAPLIHRSSVYLTTGENDEPESLVGSPARIALRLQGEAGSSYFMKTPDDIRERVSVSLNPVTGMTTFLSPPTRTAGLYELYQDAEHAALLGVAAVNIDPSETVLRPAGEDEITEFLTALGVEGARVRVVREPEQVSRTVTESRFGVELWRFMLAAAIALALFEMALARVGAGEDVTGPGAA